MKPKTAIIILFILFLLSSILVLFLFFQNASTDNAFENVEIIVEKKDIMTQKELMIAEALKSLENTKNDIVTEEEKAEALKSLENTKDDIVTEEEKAEALKSLENAKN